MNGDSKFRPCSLLEVIGQRPSVERLRSLIEFAKSKGEALSHLLFVAPDGMGKRTLAGVMAKELGTNLVTTSGMAIGRAADLLRIVTNLNDGDVLLVEELYRLPRAMEDLFCPAVQEFAVNLVMDKGIHARSVTHRLNRFTLIGTAERKDDVPARLKSVLSIAFTFSRYSDSELAAIAQRVGRERGLVLSDGAAGVVARLAAGSPGRLKEPMRFLGENAEVSEEQALATFQRLGFLPSPTATDVPHLELIALSGPEFERVISALLTRLGFRVELTKATGDGGVDIVAHLDRPLVAGRYLIQCKRYGADNLVGAPLVREFYGAVAADHRAVKGLLITTSAFTAQAREFAAQVRVELVDGDELRRLLSE